MRTNRHHLVVVMAIAFLAIFLAVQPAQAFYFRLPSALQKAIDSLKSSARAEDAGEMISAPAQSTESSGPTAAPTPQPTTGDNFSQPAPQPTELSQPAEQSQPMMFKDDGQQRQEFKGDNNFKSGNSNEQQDSHQQDNQQKNDEQNNARFLADIKRSAKDLSRQLKQFTTMMARFEKKGVKISDDTKTKVETLKADVEKLNGVTSAEDAQGLDTSSMWDSMRDLEEERQNLEKMDNIMREMKRIESEMRRFGQQIAKLEKSKITVPAEIKDNVDKVNAKIAEIKAGQIEGADDLWDLMDALNQDRQTLEVLSRWPQTVKDVNREIKRLENEFKKSKNLVARLAKQGLDLSDNLDKFAAEVERVKGVKADAEAKMAAGEVDDALESLQNDFFGQMDDVWQEQKVIMMMSNFGRFNSDFQRETNQGKREISALKRKKIDVTELTDLLNQVIAKGDEIKATIKVKPVDNDSVIAAMEELQDLGQAFDDKLGELGGGNNEDMPWEKGQSQFKEIKMSPTMDKLIPRKEAQQDVTVEQPTATSATISQ